MFRIIFIILLCLSGAVLCEFHRTVSPRIVNGRPVKDGELPFQLSLRRHGSHICGAVLAEIPGTLDTVILTGAHCVRGRSASELSLMGGSVLVDDQAGPNVQVVQVKKVIIHEEYNPDTYDYDIAVLLTSEPLKVTKWLSPIALSLSTEDDTSKVAVSGWGRTSEQPGTDAEHLQVANIPVVSNEDCAENYKAVFGDVPVIFEFHLCAGVEMGGVDSCQGDSGGPAAFTNATDSVKTLGGLTSWGAGCARPKLPGVYTRVSFFVQWIQKIASDTE